jgi:hypothetical protein
MDDAVPRLFAPHAPLPKNHGYGNQHRNAAEAKWRANQQDKQQRAVAKQLGLQLPEANPKKRAHDIDAPLSEWAMPAVPPPAESDELVRARAWSEYYAAMALEAGRTPEERTQADAWATYYAAQARQLSEAAAAAAATVALRAGAGSSWQHGAHKGVVGAQHGATDQASPTPTPTPSPDPHPSPSPHPSPHPNPNLNPYPYPYPYP